jgi:Uma2 family endonuclease
MKRAQATSPRANTAWSWEDFVKLPDDDRRELIDGELVEVEVPTKAHEHAVSMLTYFLVGWARQARSGLVLSSGYKVRVSEHRGVMPDVQFYRATNPNQPGEQGLESGHPDVAVEVVSPGSGQYDRVKKLRWYASIGTREYWIVDPAARTLERLVLREGHYVIAEALAGDAVFRPKTFRGLAIPLAELWLEEERTRRRRRRVTRKRA